MKLKFFKFFKYVVLDEKFLDIILKRNYELGKGNNLLLGDLAYLLYLLNKRNAILATINSSFIQTLEATMSIDVFLNELLLNLDAQDYL